VCKRILYYLVLVLITSSLFIDILYNLFDHIEAFFFPFIAMSDPQ